MKTELMKRQGVALNEEGMGCHSHQLELFPSGGVQTADTGGDNNEVDAPHAKNQKLERRTSLESFKEVISRCRARQIPLPSIRAAGRWTDDTLQQDVRTLPARLRQYQPKLSPEVSELLAVSISRWRSSRIRPSFRKIHDMLMFRIQSENRARKRDDQLACPSMRTLYRIMAQLEERRKRIAMLHSKEAPRRERKFAPNNNGEIRVISRTERFINAEKTSTDKGDIDMRNRFKRRQRIIKINRGCRNNRLRDQQRTISKEVARAGCSAMATTLPTPQRSRDQLKKARRGRQTADAGLELVINARVPKRPRERVQVQTEMIDIMVIDQEPERSTARPFVTVVTDEYSREILGLSVSFSPPVSGAYCKSSIEKLFGKIKKLNCQVYGKDTAMASRRQKLYLPRLMKSQI